MDTGRGSRPPWRRWPAHLVRPRVAPSLAVGLPAPGGAGPNGISVFCTHEVRPEWVPSIPRGRRCPCGRPVLGRSPPAASQRQSPSTPALLPSSGACHDEASTKGSRVFARPVFPSPVAPGWVGPLGFPPSFTLRRCRQRMSGWGQVMGTYLSYVTVTTVLLSTELLMRAASRRTDVWHW